MKKAAFFVILLPYLCFGMGMRNPQEYPDTVEKQIEDCTAFFMISTIDFPKYYEVYRIELQDNVIYQYQLANEESFVSNGDGNVFKFSISIDMVENYNGIIYIYLYNNRTKKIEVYY